jgi:hypothetical protein
LTLSTSDRLVFRIDAMVLAYTGAKAETMLYGSWLLLQAFRDSRICRSPAGIEGTAGAVDVDDQRCVIRG